MAQFYRKYPCYRPCSSYRFSTTQTPAGRTTQYYTQMVVS